MSEVTDDQYRNAARSMYANDDIEIDTDASVSQSDYGAFVQAWVWVSNEETDD